MRSGSRRTTSLRYYAFITSKTPKRVKALIAQGKEARKQTWWSKYRSALPPTYFQYIEYETAASIIRTYQFS